MENIAQHIGKNPYYQAGLIFGFALAIVAFEALLNALGWMDSDANSPWIVMTSFVLFYTLATSVLSLRTSSMTKYWSRSIIAYLVLAGLSILAAQLFSGIKIDEAGSFRWLFVVLSIGYLIFLSIVRLMKKIVDIAIKQDERLRGGGE